jgi:hypothetical protein
VWPLRKDTVNASAVGKMLSLRTSKRRQISRPTPRRTPRSWYTSAWDGPAATLPDRDLGDAEPPGGVAHLDQQLPLEQVDALGVRGVDVQRRAGGSGRDEHLDHRELASAVLSAKVDDDGRLARRH